MKKEYIPHPIDTSDVSLPASLEDLAEQIAKNVHENWAKGRIDEGWVYGEERSESLKTTPCLVAYEDLTDAEREYDRRTSMETIKLIVRLGYDIRKKDE